MPFDIPRQVRIAPVLAGVVSGLVLLGGCSGSDGEGKSKAKSTESMCAAYAEYSVAQADLFEARKDEAGLARAALAASGKLFANLTSGFDGKADLYGRIYTNAAKNAPDGDPSNSAQLTLYSAQLDPQLKKEGIDFAATKALTTFAEGQCR